MSKVGDISGILSASLEAIILLTFIEPHGTYTVSTNQPCPPIQAKIPNSCRD
jgi:hypothetical protein